MDRETFNKNVKDARLAIAQLQVERVYNEPRYFIENYCTIDHPVKGPTTYTLTEKQRFILDALVENVWVIDEIEERQIGTSTVIAGYVLWRMLFKPDERIMVTHPTYNQASFLRDRIMFMYENLPEFFKLKIIKNNKRDIELENGSMLMLRNADPLSGRGTSLSYLIFQDYDCYKGKDKDEMIYAFAPCMFTRGNAKRVWLKKVP